MCKKLVWNGRKGGLLPVLLFLFAACAGENQLPEPQAEVPGENPPSQNEPWTEDDLMGIEELVEILNDPAREPPVLFDIGGVAHLMGGKIKGAVVIGATVIPENLFALVEAAAEYPLDVDLVIYCGCCPFKDCPNIRPAFRALQEMELENVKLLDIPTNLRVDWANAGYPVDG